MADLRTSTLGAANFVLIAVLFVALTIFANHALSGARLDLTQHRLYTLAPGTTRLVGGLREPVNLYFYFSDQASLRLPQLRPYAARVRELLEELAARSGGKLRLHVIDPQPYSDDEDRATELGLKAVPLGDGDDTIWFGLAGTNSTDGRAAIEFFQPQKEQFLEYDVARLIQQLAAPARKAVGLISTLPMSTGVDPSGGMRPGWVIDAQLRELYAVKAIAADATALPDGLDALVVVQPKGLTPALYYAIDQYVLGGGRLLLCIDPDAQLDPGAEGSEAGADRSSTFEPMLAAWGMGFDPRLAVGDLGHALLVGGGRGGQPIRHLAFAGFGADALARNDVVTAGLSSINVATPGFFEPRAIDGVAFEPLLTTGPESAPIGVERLGPAASPDSLRKGFKPTGHRYVIAARVSGVLPSAFPGGPPAGVTARGPHLARSSRESNLIAVADTDFLGDMMWVRSQGLPGERNLEPWANNGDFVLNALDNLTGSAELIGIRGRPTFSRPFTRVEQLRARADDSLRAKAEELERQLAATESRLGELQTRREDRQALALSAEQQRELARFQDQKLRIRKELRSVRRGLDEQIEALGTRLKLVNLLAMPALLSVVALTMWLIARSRRRRQARLA